MVTPLRAIARICKGKVIVPPEKASTVYKNVGNFGYFDENMLTWTHCRELFHGYVRENDFFFSVDKNQIPHLIDFISKVEELLKITERTVIMYTNKENVVFVQKSKFWKLQCIRFSLFSMLLRAGLDHKEGKDIFCTMFDENNKNSKYLRDTEKHVRGFLLGKIWYTGFSRQWRDSFCTYSRFTDGELIYPMRKYGIRNIIKRIRRFFGGY